MLIIRVIGFIWPFLKEMILGDKTLKEALKTHKGRVLLIAGIILSVCMNFFAIPRLLDISSKYVLLKRDYEELQWDKKEAIDPTPMPPVVTPPKVDAVVEAPVKIAPPVAAPVVTAALPPSVKKQPILLEVKSPAISILDRQRKTKEAFDNIREREEKELEAIQKLKTLP